MKEKNLVATIACRNQGSRLYGKPLQNLDVKSKTTILDNIIACLQTISCIDEIVLAISEGIENEIFKDIAQSKGVRFITGDQEDVLSRLISAGNLAEATDIFRITSESPFPFFEKVNEVWNIHHNNGNDATFLEEVIDGCGFEIIKLNALDKSHKLGEMRHRSELCTLYIRENLDKFNIQKLLPEKEFTRKDLRLTVDNPEDLAVCRAIYMNFKALAPRVPISEIIKFLDQNPNLKDWIYPFTEQGYSTMYL